MGLISWSASINCFTKVPSGKSSFWASSAKTVYATGCVVTRDKSANVTVTGGSVWQTTNFLNTNL